MLFRGDRRLDEPIIFDVPPATLIEDALQSVSGLSGVRLHVAPELRQTRLWGGKPRKLTLRQFMSELDRSEDRRWFPEPDGGYRLVPAKAPERTNVPKPPKQEGR